MAWFWVDKERLRSVDYRELWAEEGLLTGQGKFLFWRYLIVLRGMKEFLVCLMSREVALFLWPVVMFTLFIIAMCWVTKRQCREDGFCI